MDVDFNIFENEENFQRFIKNSFKQYIRLRFGNKQKVISYIEKKFNIDIPKNSSYNEINQILKEYSRDLFLDILNVDSALEISHLYSLYKLLTDVFWETTWIKKFSPLYNFIFKKKIKIRKKSDLRKYAGRIITNFNWQDLKEKWLEFVLSEKQPYQMVYHYKHFTIGPLGPLFSLYYREKEIFGKHEPILTLLINITSKGMDIIDWERTDALRVFSFILKELNKKIKTVSKSYPTYRSYLNSAGFIFDFNQLKQELGIFVKNFKEQIVKNEIILSFFTLTQLSALFFKDEEVIHLINRLIADMKLVINPEMIETGDLKITKDAIIKKPKSWLVKPAFEFVKDINSVRPVTSDQDFRNLLTNVLQIGTIRYLEEIFDSDFELFKALCTEKGLYKFASLDRHIIPKDMAIRMLLETYGLKTPSMFSLNFREECKSFIYEINQFKMNYKELEDLTFVETISMFLNRGRRYFERLLKEWLFILTALVIHYENSVSRNTIENIFLLDWPIFHIPSFDQNRTLNAVVDKYKEFLMQLEVSEDLKNKISLYVTTGKSNFTLGDYYSLTKFLMKHIKQNQNLSNNFWNSLPIHFHNNLLKTIRDLESFIIKKNALKWLNIASHQIAMVEFRKNIGNRQEALDTLLKIDEVISSTIQNFPEIIIIKSIVTEARTGLEYYEAEYTSIENEIKIYGTRYITHNFLYYIIQRFEDEENIVIYPILITNLADTIF